MILLCLACSRKVAPTLGAPFSCCPYCGDRGIPADTDDALTVTITRHELRILVMWAEFWAVHNQKGLPSMQPVVAGIARRLRDQDPQQGSLTFSDELVEVADAYPGMETNFPIQRDDTDPRGGITS